MKAKILYADDEPAYLRLVKMFLESEGHQVLTAKNGTELLELYGKHPDAHLIILDLMMPELDGWQVCGEIRRFSRVPVLMLTALDDESSEVQGIKTGADDYIGKPFSKALLTTRVQALLRRSQLSHKEKLDVKKLSLNMAAREVKFENKAIILTFREFQLLTYLLENKDIICSRDKILQAVWGYFYQGDSRTINTHIKSLRKKLGDAGKAIVTYRNLGYAFKEDRL